MHTGRAANDFVPLGKWIWWGGRRWSGAGWGGVGQSGGIGWGGVGQGGVGWGMGTDEKKQSLRS